MLAQALAKALDGRDAEKQPVSSTPASPAPDFLDDLLDRPWGPEEAKREESRILAEIRELQQENRWDDILALFYPLEQQAPLLREQGLDLEVGMKLSFALVRAGRHDEAIELLLGLEQRDPDNELLHYNLGYAGLDALFQARSSRAPLPSARRRELVALAHAHFRRACALRPASVTFWYRHGVLYKEIERKTRQAIPLFEQAVANWLRRSPEEQRQEHQQRPKYIKALYHLASCLLDNGRPAQALVRLERLLEEDRESNVMAPVFRHFAMGKVLHALGRFQEALEHLDTAAVRAEPHQPTDFVHELAARCLLRLERPGEARERIDRVPSRKRRAYVLWTEADVLVALERPEEALAVLRRANERDRRGRHKGLLRMARILIALGRPGEARECCQQASAFYQDTYGNPCQEARFWEAAACLRLGCHAEGLELLKLLRRGQFRYPHMDRLEEALRQGREEAARSGRARTLRLAPRPGQAHAAGGGDHEH